MVLPGAGPRPPAARIASVDALRGIALCGILFINIFQMGGPFAMSRPLSAPSLGDADWQVWTIAELFVAGTMRGLFSLLFGVSLLISIGDDGSADRSARYLRRMIVLFLFGIVDCTLLLWPGDILITYALAGFVALVLYPLRSSRLLAAAGVMLIVVTAWSAYDAHGLTSEMTVYSDAQLAAEAAARLSDYGRNFEYLSRLSWTLTVGSLSYRWIGDALIMMLVGMVLHRKGLLGDEASSAVLARMLWIGYGAGLALRLVHVLLVLDSGGGPTVVSTLVEQPGRVAMTLGHFALFQLLWRRFRAPLAKAMFAGMGRMALTLYLGQSLLAAAIFSGFGLGLWNQLSWPELWLVALAILVIEAVFAALWFRAFRFGPAEWLWRWGTYGRRPAISR